MRKNEGLKDEEVKKEGTRGTNEGLRDDTIN